MVNCSLKQLTIFEENQFPLSLMVGKRLRETQLTVLALFKCLYVWLRSPGIEEG